MDNQEVVDFVRERLYPEKYNKKDEPLSLCEINKQVKKYYILFKIL